MAPRGKGEALRLRLRSLRCALDDREGAQHRGVVLAVLVLHEAQDLQARGGDLRQALDLALADRRRELLFELGGPRTPPVGVGQHAEKRDLQRKPLRGGQRGGVRHPETRQAGRLGVCKDADGMAPAGQGRPCGEVVVSAESGVVGDLAADVSFERVALREHASNLQVDEPPPGLRERPVRALAHQIVREVVAGAARGLGDDQDAVLLQLAHRGEQVARRDAARLREPVEIEPAAHRGCPWHHVARDRIQARQALVDHGAERIGDDAVAAGERAGDLDGEERVPAAPGEDLRGVDGAGVLLDEKRHLGFVQGREGALDEPALASERTEETLDRGVVAELRGPRPRSDEDPGNGTACHVMQERRRRLVEPLQVVEHDGQRRALGHAGDEPRDGFEEPVPVDAIPVGPELREERRQLAAQALDRSAERNGAERVHPRSVGADHLAFEAAPRQNGPPCGADCVPADLEEPRLSDARLAEEEDRGGRGPSRRGGHVLGDRRALRRASNEKLACRCPRSKGGGGHAAPAGAGAGALGDCVPTRERAWMSRGDGLVPSSAARMREHVSYCARASRLRPSRASSTMTSICAASESGSIATRARACASAVSGVPERRSMSAERTATRRALAASRSATHHSW